jgi:hypothetical protein
VTITPTLMALDATRVLFSFSPTYSCYTKIIIGFLSKF